MEYAKHGQYKNTKPYRPSRPYPNGWVGDQCTADLICGHIDAGGGVREWKRRIENLMIVLLPDSTKPMSSVDTRAARQGCYEPVGVLMSVREYVAKVADLPEKKQVKDPNIAYEDLWWDCQGGHCVGHAGITGRPYIQFLPPAGPESASPES